MIAVRTVCVNCRHHLLVKLDQGLRAHLCLVRVNSTNVDPVTGGACYYDPDKVRATYGFGLCQEYNQGDCPNYQAKA